ncbi:MAG TPA: nucleoside kinase [Anaerolineales bacterium]|nr:nucleoside kinase [Anaerolineales bacterium]
MKPERSSDKAFEVRKGHPRPTVELYLPDGRVIEGPRGAPLSDFVGNLEGETAPIVGGVLNGELRELTFPIEVEAKLRPVTMAESDGMRIYRRSLTFLLAAAFEELFPGAWLTVDHSVSSGGYYCQVGDRPPLTLEELGALEARMRSLVEDDIPFAKLQVPVEEAIAHFERLGYADKVRLLHHRRKPRLVLYGLGPHRDYHHGYMLPSSGYLRWFGLVPTGDGFTLRFPRRRAPQELLPLPEYPKLLTTFRQYGAWLDTLGIGYAGALNDAIAEGRAAEVVLASEALHEQRIAAIAGEIAERLDSVRLVLIAGPSASGKTTFSKRLSVQLMARGIRPFPLELDSFFVDRAATPRDENGAYDFESLAALDLDRLNHDLHKLISGETVRLPRYDFKRGIREDGLEARLAPGQVLLLEGIHGLNPELTPRLPPGQAYRIYASALTQLNLDRYNRVSTTDTRLIRRIVRDASQRGYSAAETIQRWESVRRGEKRNIFPFQENADVMFNSALVYEASALVPLAEPLIRQVASGTPEHVEAKRLLAFLEWFLPLPQELVPDNSLLREFIGGSIFEHLKAWPRLEGGQGPLPRGR